VEQDGVERLRRWRDEDTGVPPAVGRLSAQLASVERSRTQVRLPLTPELLLPDGRSSGAVTALLADIGLTTSVVASLPDLRGVTTISMTVDHLGLPPAGGHATITCVAGDYVDGGPQHATGVITDDGGVELARVSGWFLPTPAEGLSAERVGLVQEPLAGDLHDLLGVGSANATGFTLVARDALSNALGSLHGGIGALASQLAAEAALEGRVRPLTSTFAFLRPTPRDGRVTVTGTAVRQGRRTASASSAVVGPDDRLVLQCSVVAAVLT
jgi:acyl-coenzyme A thioesterase PaaI-like protein